MLQAVCLALRELGDLQPAERALGLDRAEILIDKHVHRLGLRWRGQVMPEALRELMADAKKALADQLNQRELSHEQDA